LKPEWWGSPLALEEKYQGRKKTRDNKIIIIIIIYCHTRNITHHKESATS
jgi:hypothetical protein